MALLRPAVCNKIFAFATNDIIKTSFLRTVTPIWQDTIDNYSHEMWNSIIKKVERDDLFEVIFDACCSGRYIDFLRNCIIHGVNVDSILSKTGWTAIALASYNGCTDIVKLLLDAGCNKDLCIMTRSYDVLRILGKKKRTKSCAFFESFFFNVHKSDIGGQTPLFLACANGYDEILDLLITAGCDINEKCNGISPIYIAAKNGHTECCRKLIAEKVHLDGNNIHKGLTALAQCCIDGRTEIVKMLIDAKCDIEIMYTANGYNDRPLHLACKKRHLEIVKLLLDANVDIDSKNGNEKTALNIMCPRTVDITRIKAYNDFVQLLVKHKDKINSQN